MSYLFVFLLLVISQPSLSNTDGSLEPSYSSIDFEVWLVGALAFLAAVILLTFNWILFFSAIYKTNKEYRKYEQSLQRRRQNIQMRHLRRGRGQEIRPHDRGGLQDMSPRPMNPGRPSPGTSFTGECPPGTSPMAITYRSDCRSPREVYVSLTQLRTMVERDPLSVPHFLNREDSAAADLNQSLINQSLSLPPSSPLHSPRVADNNLSPYYVQTPSLQQSESLSEPPPNYYAAMQTELLPRKQADHH